MTHRVVRRGIGALAGAAAVATCPLLATAPAQAATAECVAVIVDSSSRVSARCMSWHSGLTGAGALSGTGHSYRLAPSGLICAIDGFPADCHVDSTHYWSYWHKAPGSGSWTYSSEGAGTYNPRSGETEGWAYQNGSSRQPASIAFSTICPPPPEPTPPPPPRPNPSPPPAGGGTGTAPGKYLPAGGQSAGAASPPRAGSTPRTSAAPGPAGASSGAPGKPATPIGAAIGPRRQSRPARSDGPVQSVLLAGLGVVAAAGLAAAAWRRTRKPG
ncbi:MAG: hypothetical protein ABJA34_04080 [Pseudonocardiales bacterium]